MSNSFGQFIFNCLIAIAIIITALVNLSQGATINKLEHRVEVLETGK